jgi:hypothetical protein
MLTGENRFVGLHTVYPPASLERLISQRGSFLICPEARADQNLEGRKALKNPAANCRESSTVRNAAIL